MKKNIIFDLDLTLVDTTLAEPYRSNRDWNGAYSVLPQCTVYEGLQEVFDVICKFVLIPVLSVPHHELMLRRLCSNSICRLII